MTILLADLGPSPGNREIFCINVSISGLILRSLSKESLEGVYHDGVSIENQWFAQADHGNNFLNFFYFVIRAIFYCVRPGF
jgi:hypothetical protein